MLLLTPMMMHPWMKFMLLMLMMSMLIIMDDTTDDDHDNNNDIYVSGPDPDQTGPDRSGPGRTEPDQSKIHYIQSKNRVDHYLQSWIGPRVQL